MNAATTSARLRIRTPRGARRWSPGSRALLTALAGLAGVGGQRGGGERRAGGEAGAAGHELAGEPDLVAPGDHHAELAARHALDARQRLERGELHAQAVPV